MKFRHGLTIATTLVLAATLGLGGTPVFADKVSDSKAAGNAVSSQYQDAQSAVAKINDQISNKTVEINKAKDNLADLKTKAADNEKAIKKTSDELASRKETMKKQLKALQKEQADSATGNVYLDFLLSSESFSDAISRVSTISQLSSANKQSLDDVQASQKKLSDLKQELADDQKKAEETAAKLQDDMKNLEAQKASAETAAKNLQTQVNANKDKIASVEASAPSAGIAAPKKNASVSHSSYKPSNVHANGLAGTALQFLGVPYVWGGSTPAGFDCSGLVAYSARLNGMSMPRTSQAMSAMGPHVSVGSLNPGDLVFWGAPAYHVGIYLGGGRYVHAPAPGQSVKVQSVAGWAPQYGIHL